MIRYLSRISNGKAVLWGYFIWWANTVLHHFDPSPAIWLNSVGISAVIGVALMLAVGGVRAASSDKWQLTRLFVMPFCTSSFAALIKGQGFILVFSSSVRELAAGTGLCAAFAMSVFVLRRR